MSRKLSKSIDEYLAAGGWSSNLFFEHAKVLFEDQDIKTAVTFDVGRSVIHLKSNDKVLKAYVHHNGRTKEYMTLVGKDNTEYATFHFSASTCDIKKAILEYFNVCNHKWTYDGSSGYGTSRYVCIHCKTTKHS